MKKTGIPYCIAFLLLTILCSCEKDSFVNYDVSYSYKLSGSVTLVPSQYVNATTAELDSMLAAGDLIDTLQCPIKPEQGQLRVVKKGENQSFLTFNAMTGTVTIANACIDKKHFNFEGKDKEVGIVINKRGSNNNNIEDLITDPSHYYTTYVQYTGEGDEYGQTLIFTLAYSGEVQVKNLLEKENWTIVSSNIECVATQNK